MLAEQLGLGLEDPEWHEAAFFRLTCEIRFAAAKE